MSASAEVNDLMMELMLHMTRGTVRLTSSSPSRTSTELIWIYLWISRVSRTSQWTRETELKYAKDQGFCTTLRYVVFTDGKNKIGDAMRIQNTALDASRLFVDPVFFGAFASRSVLLLSPGIEREWGRTANPEYNVLTTAEVTDILPELKYCI